MARTSCLTAIITVGALAASAVPAYGQYANTFVQQDTSTYDLSAGFDANPNDGGVQNTAFGFFALENNGCCGYYNSAFGYTALQNNTLGAYNTALGYSALWESSSGSQNTAAGAGAMFWTTGSNNSAVGYNAMEQNSSGSYNTAVGYESLGGNSSSATRQTGNNNTAVGANALYANTTGNGNTASGYNALNANKTGKQNTAIGQAALHVNTSGNNNIALGFQAGVNLTTGDGNIDIGNTGVAGESRTLRIGSNQGLTYIAGITGHHVSGVGVVVDSNGQLGVGQPSAQRFKTGVAPMGSASAKLAQLRPVTFRYKSSSDGALQYGLIAEEVARVYPDLVVRSDSGRIEGVRYDELAPLLLNELQQQQTKMAAQDQHSAAQDAQINQLTEQLAEMHAALDKLQNKDELSARR